MKFVISSGALLKQLQGLSGVLSTSNTLPILDNFLFEIEDGQLTISASDVETTMKAMMEVDAEIDGRVAIPAKLLLDILKNLPDQPCAFGIDLENYTIEISYDNGKSKMVGFDADDFPRAPKLEGGDIIKISGDVVSNAINKTLFATGVDDLRPVMSGVFCEFSPESITFVATDAHKLVRYTRKDSQASGSSSFILPKKPLNLLKSNLKGEEEVQLEYNESNAIFTFNDMVLSCRLIDGKYPNYEAVIPRETPNILTVDRQQILSSIKRVSIFASKTTHQIVFKLIGSELSLSAEDVDFANAAKERLTCDYAGDDMEIGFNSRFLLEMLNNLDSKEIMLKLSESNRAGLIVPVDLPDHEDVLMVIMPVMI